MGEPYLIGTWTGFVQQIQYLVSRGYDQYCMVEYPWKKQDKFVKIDKKLIEKYSANTNKDKAYYNKKKGYVNYKFLRWSNQAIILKSKGEIKQGIIEDDQFLHRKDQKIAVQIGDKMTLLIGTGSKGKLTVTMDRESYRVVKATCLEYLEDKKYHKMIDTFNHLNSLPCWGGIVEQKIRLKEKLIEKLKKEVENKKVISLSEKLKINTKRIPVKVF